MARPKKRGRFAGAFSVALLAVGCAPGSAGSERGAADAATDSTTGHGGGAGSGAGGASGGASGGRSGGGASSGGAATGGVTSLDSGAPPGKVEVRVVGRADGPVTARRFSWSGVSVQARFLGTQVSADLDGGDNNYFEVVIDGNRMPRVATTAGRKTISLASGLSNGEHELVLWRRSEANNYSPSTFYGLDLAGGTLLPITAPPHKLEVIGDSLSCGYGNEGTNPCKFSYDTENDYTAYGSVAARQLHADLYTECWSGKGMYRDYDGATSEPFPVFYPRTIATDPKSVWGFSYTPDAVIVNLGTNDFAKGDPGAPYETAYAAFVKMLRGHYPNAFLFLVIGPALAGQDLVSARAYLDQVISERKAAGDTKIVQILVEPQDEKNGIGCDYHPSEKTHALMGKVVADAIAAQLGW